MKIFYFLLPVILIACEVDNGSESLSPPNKIESLSKNESLENSNPNPRSKEFQEQDETIVSLKSEETMHDDPQKLNQKDNSSLNKNMKLTLNQDILNKFLEGCLKLCTSFEDSMACIQQAVSEIQKKVNHKRPLSGMEEIGDVAQDELKKAIESYIDYKTLDLYYACKYLPNYIAVDFDTVYEINMSFQWCNDYSNYGLRRCYTQCAEHYDSLIATHYHSIINGLDSKEKNAFEEIQQAWLNYVDAESNIYTKISREFKGSMYPTVSLSNHERIKRQRALELKQHVDLLR